MFKKKENVRYRAIVGAKGCQQKKNSLDFSDTYSFVVRIQSLRTLLAIAAMQNLKIKNFDIKSAFLYGNLEEEILMKLPEGYNHLEQICVLQKALYGLRQAPRQWYKKLTDFLKAEGLIRTKSDRCF